MNTRETLPPLTAEQLESLKSTHTAVRAELDREWADFDIAEDVYQTALAAFNKAGEAHDRSYDHIAEVAPFLLRGIPSIYDR